MNIPVNQKIIAINEKAPYDNRWFNQANPQVTNIANDPLPYSLKPSFIEKLINNQLLRDPFENKK